MLRRTWCAGCIGDLRAPVLPLPPASRHCCRCPCVADPVLSQLVPPNGPTEGSSINFLSLQGAFLTDDNIVFGLRVIDVIVVAGAPNGTVHIAPAFAGDWSFVNLYLGPLQPLAVKIPALLVF